MFCGFYFLSIGASYDVGFGQKIFMMCNGTGLPTGLLYLTLTLLFKSSKNYVTLLIIKCQDLCGDSSNGLCEHITLLVILVVLNLVNYLTFVLICLTN